MRPLLRALLLAALLGASLVSAGTSVAAGRACEDVIVRSGNGDVYWRTYYLAAYNTSCSVARRVARGFLNGTEGNADPNPRPLGFRCRATRTKNGPGFACRKGRRQVRWLSQPLR